MDIHRVVSDRVCDRSRVFDRFCCYCGDCCRGNHQAEGRIRRLFCFYMLNAMLGEGLKGVGIWS